MDILFFCTRWGSADVPLANFAAKVKQAGYDGIETDIPIDKNERTQLLNILADHQLKLIAQHWETSTADFSLHAAEYATRLSLLASVNPLCINAHTGKDHFDFVQNAELIRSAEMISQKTGVPVYHETHRGRFSFAAHVTKQYLASLPSLQLTLDISHWCAVAESFLHDQPEAVAMAIDRTRHIHARIGYTQGPQVPDPRSATWQEALDFHLSCWDQIITKHTANGTQTLTITPEFGPFPYMIPIPSSNEPIANQWEINLWMMKLLKERYTQTKR